MEENKITTEQLNAGSGPRKAIGFILLLVFGTMGLLSGFGFYNISGTVIWAVGIVGLALMISGIAKDVVAIAKNVIK